MVHVLTRSHRPLPPAGVPIGPALLLALVALLLAALLLAALPAVLAALTTVGGDGRPLLDWPGLAPMRWTQVVADGMHAA